MVLSNDVVFTLSIVETDTTVIAMFIVKYFRSASQLFLARCVVHISFVIIVSQLRSVRWPAAVVGYPGDGRSKLFVSARIVLLCTVVLNHLLK